MSVTDPDVALDFDGVLVVTVTVLRGTLALPAAALAGLFMLSPAGVQRSVSFAASIPSANSALAYLEYTPDANWNGVDTLTVDVDDRGFSGAGGPLSASGTVAITVTPVK